jgi:2-amino-4-hydroxy-6-hydroxymethyldihydropteridine diphosphokinase
MQSAIFDRMLYFLSQGSNLGNRSENFRRAIMALKSLGEIQSLSSIYESEPWGFESEDWFWNMVVALESTLGPEDLLSAILEIEKEMGRNRSAQSGYSSRIIDIDLLSTEDLIQKSPLLELPHPRLAERRFVLAPWADIAPEYSVPGLNQTVSNLLAKCPDTTICRKLKDVPLYSH